MRWILDRLRGAFNRSVETWILIAAGAVGLAAWRVLRSNHHVRADISVPTWLIAVVVGVVVAVLGLLALRLRHRRGQLRELAGGVEGMVDVVEDAEQAREITVAYAEHLIEILYAFQRVLNGEIPGITVKEWIEDGILEPARDLIRTRQAEDVRLSILVPEGDEFVMAFAAGHTLASKTMFRLPIERSFSRWSFQTNTIIWSSDLANDDRFTPHPRSARERDYDSIISVPISSGAGVVAVFNAIFTPENAFDEADLLYVRLIGAVTQLVWEITGGP